MLRKGVQIKAGCVHRDEIMCNTYVNRLKLACMHNYIVYAMRAKKKVNKPKQTQCGTFYDGRHAGISMIFCI
jgi:hypothetical protein